MKVKAKKKDVMVRIVVAGKPVYVGSDPVDIDVVDDSVKQQIKTWLDRGLLEVVKHSGASGSGRKAEEEKK